MTHDKDLQGRPWSPGPSCSHSTPGSCSSRGHRKLCDYCECHSDTPSSAALEWRRHVAARPPENRPARKVPLGLTVPIPADLVIRTHINGFTGYAQSAIALADELRRHGVLPAFESLGTDDRFVPPPAWVRDRTVPRATGPVLQVAGPTHMPDDRRTVTLTMWEGSRLSPEAVAALNRVELVLVPCQWNARTFVACGVTTPIRVQPLGIPIRTFRPIASPPGGPFTFGCAGRLHHGGIRKGLQDVIRSFRAAFLPTNTDVRLRVKIWPDDPAIDTDGDPRIEVLRNPLPIEGLADWYRSLDVFVSASRAEGFGLQPLQAMACGTPILAGFHTGHLEYLTEACAWEIPCRVETVAVETYGGLGEWYTPDPDGLVEGLRAVIRQPAEVRAKGARAAEIARAWTWDRAGTILYDTLAGHLGWPSSLPARPTLGLCGLIDRLDTLPEAIPLIRPHVDRVHFLVDDRADPAVCRWLDDHGVPWQPHRWTGSFAEAMNAAADAVGTDWILQLDADEILQGADHLRAAVTMAGFRGADVVWLKRRHWFDLNRTRDRPDWFPDWQYRLRRRTVRLRWRAHPEVVALPQPPFRWEADDLYLEHFNLALRSKADWARIDAEYAARLAEDRTEGRDWSDPELATQPEPELPSLFRQVGGFLKSAVAVIASGFQLATDAEKDRRLAICHACEFYRGDGRCGGQEGCGCTMAIKAEFATLTCPRDRWAAPQAGAGTSTA